ncbi:MAG: phage gp6-like head-tail connector protein [Prevotella sp.]|nr:phage gp6-like head-tail connector protein [Prevotella sp.]
MKWLKISYIKQHSRIDFDCEDDLLELYGDSAEETVAQLLNRGRTVDECAESLTADYGKVPAAVIQATLMLVDVSYNHRAPISPVNMSMVPYTFDLLINPYMRLADPVTDHETEEETDDNGTEDVGV